jgi:hypothetical protein
VRWHDPNYEQLEQHVRDRDHFFARHGFGRGFVGWAGPVFWPYGYHDLFNYTFWPSFGDYYDPFWAYGYDELFAGVFWPAEADQFDASGAKQRRARADIGEAPNSGQLTPHRDLCAKESAVPLPFGRIGKAVQPTGDAQSKLNDLETVATSAALSVKDACPSRMAATPTARLAAVEARLTALLVAVEAVRAPLNAFYGSLDPAQKAQLDRMSMASTHGNNTVLIAAEKTPLGPGRICGQHTTAIAQFPIDEIATAVSLNGVQATYLNDLRGASVAAAEKIKASCLAQTPTLIMERFEAVQTRLAALRDAVITVTPALTRLFNSLDQEQRARVEQLRWQQ